MSRIRRVATLGAQGAGLAALGFAITGAPALRALPDFLRPPTNEATLRLAAASAGSAGGAVLAAEDAIDASSVARAARQEAQRQENRREPGSSAVVATTESRPHLKIHAAHARRSLTAGTLNGPGRTTVPPAVWTWTTTTTAAPSTGGGDDGNGRAAMETTRSGTLTSVWHVGGDVCGHPGVVHGGYLATMLDEALGRCCIGLLPQRVALTAELRVDYVAPVPADSLVVLRAETTRVVGRKAWVEARLETLEESGAEPTVLARATALFVSPRSAGVLATLYPVA